MRSQVTGLSFGLMQETGVGVGGAYSSLRAAVPWLALGNAETLFLLAASAKGEGASETLRFSLWASNTLQWNTGRTLKRLRRES